MYCPKCSQEQISDNIRFCSRCGFQLNVVQALLIDDEISVTQNSAAGAAANSLRKRDLTIGALLMFFFALIVAIITVDMPASHSARIVGLIVAWLALSVLINIVPIIRYFFYGNTEQDSPLSSGILSSLTARFKRNNHNVALPAAYSKPVTDYVTGAIKTAEIQPLPSVTEETTNLLNNNQS